MDSGQPGCVRFRVLDSDLIVEGEPVELTLCFAVLWLALVNTDEEAAEPPPPPVAAENARKLDGVEGDIDEGSSKADGDIGKGLPMMRSTSASRKHKHQHQTSSGKV